MKRTNKMINLSKNFPKAHLYADLQIQPELMIRETRADENTFSYSERHLQCVWFDSLYRPKTLHSKIGEEITVENPGRWNLEAGPDFLDAVLIIGKEQRRIKGDVEIHIRQNDWQKHGHANDPRYDHIIAHVSYFPGPFPAEALPAAAIALSLKDALQTNPTFCFDSIDVTAYPYASLPKHSTPCAETLTSWSAADKVALLEAAGEERLTIKTSRMIAGIKERGEEQLLYEEIMCSLGYKHNRGPFRQLTHRLTLETLIEESGKDPINAYSLLLGTAGLLPSKTSTRWDSETCVFIRGLWDNWWKIRSKWENYVMPKSSWHLSGLRPQNHPARRLAAAASLFTRETSFARQLAAINTSDPKNWFKKVESLIQHNTVMDYWKRRLSFSGKLQNSDSALIGSRRIAGISSNVIIPFLAATGNHIAPLLDLLPPEEDNSLIRQTAFVLFGRDHNPALYQKGIRQQGLLQIFHDFCLNNKTGCKDCQLAGALKAEAQSTIKRNDPKQRLKQQSKKNARPL